MINKICTKLSKSIGDLYIQSIIKTEEIYLITLSDKYGNDMDTLPLGFSCVDGHEVAVDFDCNTSGADWAIPDKYTTYRNVVCERLVQNMPDDVVEALGPHGIHYVVNALYTEYVADISIDELYAICSYLIYVIAATCSKEEKENIGCLLTNDAVRSFLEMNNSEKLNTVNNFYYAIFYLKEDIASEKEIDKKYCEELTKNMQFAISNFKEIHKKETDSI